MSQKLLEGYGVCGHGSKRFHCLACGGHTVDERGEKRGKIWRRQGGGSLVHGTAESGTGGIEVGAVAAELQTEGGDGRAAILHSL